MVGPIYISSTVAGLYGGSACSKNNLIQTRLARLFVALYFVFKSLRRRLFVKKDKGFEYGR